MAASRSSPSPDPAQALPAAVAAALAAAGLAPGARIRLALSGGVDSVALLHLLHRFAPRFDFQLSARHVHHGLSPQADRWLAFCADQCAALGVPFEGWRVTVDRDDPQGLEAAARRVRLAALEGPGADWLALGHHLDDQAETLLFRLIRGTGLRGAGGMRQLERPLTGLPRLRPLLQVRRGAIEAWARGAGLAWVEDESNADTRFARNHLRHQVLPLLEGERPGAGMALARAAGHFQEASDLLDELAALDGAGCGGEFWGRGVFLALSPARQANLVRWRMRALGGATPESARLAEALRQVREVAGGVGLHLPLGELALCLFRETVWLEPVEAGAPAPQPVAWPLAGAVVLPWGRGRVVLEPAEGAGLSHAALGRAVCRLVSRWPGMGLRPHRNGPMRSFKNLCQEAGVPPWQRDILPVLAVGSEAVWVAGLGIAAGFACLPGDAGIVPRWERR
ncbi:MAG: tRNA lysidine(34) synthetase TilS [Rhodocyclaceae bacterium]|jgi:tRNA(Ile)-lysidine synthase|nr:tRNA lysidine(34) synthetase TilS [Rhodocyclaceae bacterium]